MKKYENEKKVNPRPKPEFTFYRDLLANSRDKHELKRKLKNMPELSWTATLLPYVDRLPEENLVLNDDCQLRKFLEAQDRFVSTQLSADLKASEVEGLQILMKHELVNLYATENQLTVFEGHDEDRKEQSLSEWYYNFSSPATIQYRFGPKGEEEEITEEYHQRIQRSLRQSPAKYLIDLLAEEEKHIIASTRCPRGNCNWWIELPELEKRIAKLQYQIETRELVKNENGEPRLDEDGNEIPKYKLPLTPKGHAAWRFHLATRQPEELKPNHAIQDASAECRRELYDYLHKNVQMPKPGTPEWQRLYLLDHAQFGVLEGWEQFQKLREITVTLKRLNLEPKDLGLVYEIIYKQPMPGEQTRLNTRRSYNRLREFLLKKKVAESVLFQNVEMTWYCKALIDFNELTDRLDHYRVFFMMELLRDVSKELYERYSADVRSRLSRISEAKANEESIQKELEDFQRVFRSDLLFYCMFYNCVLSGGSRLKRSPGKGRPPRQFKDISKLGGYLLYKGTDDEVRCKVEDLYKKCLAQWDEQNQKRLVPQLPDVKGMKDGFNLFGYYRGADISILLINYFFGEKIYSTRPYVQRGSGGLDPADLQERIESADPESFLESLDSMSDPLSGPSYKKRGFKYVGSDFFIRDCNLLVDNLRKK